MKTSISARNSMLNTLATLADGGYLRIYDGRMPENPEARISRQTLLAELQLSTPAFKVARGAEIQANEISDDLDAKATGKASWYRLTRADGETVLWDGTVGLVGADLNLNSTDIQENAKVSISSLSYTQP